MLIVKNNSTSDVVLAAGSPKPTAPAGKVMNLDGYMALNSANDWLALESQRKYIPTLVYSVVGSLPYSTGVLTLQSVGGATGESGAAVAQGSALPADVFAVLPLGPDQVSGSGDGVDPREYQHVLHETFDAGTTGKTDYLYMPFLNGTTEAPYALHVFDVLANIQIPAKDATVAVCCIEGGNGYLTDKMDASQAGLVRAKTILCSHEVAKGDPLVIERSDDRVSVIMTINFKRL